MKFLVSLLLAVPLFASAETATTPEKKFSETPLIEFVENGRWAVGADHEIAICIAPNVRERLDTCKTPNGENGWRLARQWNVSGIIPSTYVITLDAGKPNTLVLYWDRKR